MDGVYAAGYFLFSLAFGLVTFVLWVRLALRYFHVSSVNSVSRSIYQFTEPAIRPIKQLLDQPHLRQGRYDWPCLALLLGVEVLKFILIGGLFFKGKFPWFLVLVYRWVDMIMQGLSILMYAVLIRALLSWFNPTWRHPFNDILIVVTEPVLSITRR